MTPSAAKRLLAAAAVATALLASGCAGALAEAAEDTRNPAAEAVEWQPSEEWLMLRSWAEEVAALRATAIDAPDRETALDAYEQYRQEKTALEDYLIAHPGADAPCDVLYSYAPPERWPDGPCPTE